MTIWYEKLFLQNELYFLITEYIYTLTDNFNVYIILTLLIMFNKN